MGRTHARQRGGLGLILLAALCLLPVLTACGQGEEAAPVDLARRQVLTPDAPETGVTYAYLPQYSHSESFRRHRGIVRRLTRATGLPFRQVFPATFDEHVDMVARGELDISFSNPFVYVRLAEHGAQAFARVVESAQGSDFRGQIIVRADSGIQSLDDCKGKRWIAVDPGSAGGYLFPLGHFAEHGVNRWDFEEIAFAPGPGGKQEKVVLAVFAGTYDLGSVREGALEVLGGAIDTSRIRVLAQTRAYPGWVYAARKGLDPALVTAVSSVLQSLDPADPADAEILAAARIKAVIPARDAEYDPVRRLARRLGLDSFQAPPKGGEDP